MPSIPRPDLASLALCAVAVVGIVVLVALRQPVPDVLTYVVAGALGVGGGTALNTGRPAVPADPSPASFPAPAPAPAPQLRRPMPTPLAADPPTGVFRMATHSPEHTGGGQ